MTSSPDDIQAQQLKIVYLTKVFKFIHTVFLILIYVIISQSGAKL